MDSMDEWLTLIISIHKPETRCDGCDDIYDSGCGAENIVTSSQNAEGIPLLLLRSVTAKKGPRGTACPQTIFLQNSPSGLELFSRIVFVRFAPLYERSAKNMSYAIIRNENHKVGAVPLLERHNERLNKNYSNKDIDINRSSENYYLKKIQAESYLQEFESIRTRQELKGNLRLQGKKQSTVLCEFVITSDKEFFDRLGGERTKKFFEDAYDFVTAKVGGEQYILSAVVHMDEATPTLLLTARV